jgi:hypothetical protein
VLLPADSSGVVEGVGGPGRNIEGGSLPAGGMGTGASEPCTHRLPSNETALSSI